MSLVEVTHQLFDAEQEPQTGVIFTATLLAPYGYLTGDGEITAAIQAETGDDGVVHLFLTPVSEIEYVGAVYEILWAKQRRVITVPDSGPVKLRDVLTAEPAGGAVVVPVTGRGIVSQSYNAGTGIITFTYSDGTTATIGPLAQGPPGEPGEDGAGTVTVAGLTIRRRKLVARDNGSGTVILEPAKLTYDVVDDYGADPTGVADSSAAFLSCLSDATAAALAGAAGQNVKVNIPDGRYLIASATRLVRGRNVNIDGNGANIRFTNAAGGWSFGGLTQADHYGFMRDMIIDGTDVARNPLYVGWAVGCNFAGLRVIGGGYNAGDTQAVRDKSAAIVVEAAQNCLFTNVTAQLSQHRGMVFDYGCGGLSFVRTQINDIGQAGSADARHIIAMQSVPATVGGVPGPLPGGGTHPTVYDKPSNIEIRRGYIEGVTNTATYMVELGDCESVHLSKMRIGCSSRNVAMSQVYAGPLSDDVVLEGCTHQGNNTAANPVKVVTGLQVAAGAKGARVTGPHQYSNMAAGWSMDDQADLIMDTPPYFTAGASAVQSAGVGARRIVRNYSVRATTLANLPTPSVDYLGVTGLAYAAATGTYDEIYTCLRRGGVYLWVKSTAGSASPTVLTHVAGIEQIIDASVNTAFTITALGNLAIGSTINNSSGRLYLLTINPGASSRDVTFDTTGIGSFVFTTAVPGPTLVVPANKRAVIGWQYDVDTTKNRLLAFTVES